MNKIIDYIKNNTMTVIGGVAVLLIVYALFFRGNKITHIATGGKKSGNITTEQRLYNEIEGLRNELKDLKKELDQERMLRKKLEDKKEKRVW